MLSCIIYYVYPFTFFHANKYQYLSCTIAINNSQNRSDLKMPVEIAFFHRSELHLKLLIVLDLVLKLFSFGIQIELPWPWVNLAQRLCKHQVLTNVYSQFYIEIEWLWKNFTTLEACRMDSQWHTFSKWATNIWENVGKLVEHLNPKGGNMRFEPITLNQTHLFIFYLHHSIKVSFDS
jgi:hypothetical protein